MLTLVKTDLAPSVQQRVIRMQLDTRLLQTMSVAEINAVYAELEWIRDTLSLLLDRVDGKHA